MLLSRIDLVQMSRLAYLKLAIKSEKLTLSPLIFDSPDNNNFLRRNTLTNSRAFDVPLKMSSASTGDQSLPLPSATDLDSDILFS